MDEPLDLLIQGELIVDGTPRPGYDVVKKRQAGRCHKP